MQQMYYRLLRWLLIHLPVRIVALDDHFPIDCEGCHRLVKMKDTHVHYYGEWDHDPEDYDLMCPTCH